MNTDIKERDDDTLAAEYAIGVLPLNERIAFENRLINDQALVAQVDWWNEQFIPMSEEIEAVDPPKQLLGKIEQRLFQAETGSVSWWQSLDLWRGLSIASLSGMIIFGGLYVSQINQNSNPDRSLFVGQLSSDESDLKLVAYYDSSSNQLRLNRTSGQALPERSLELWIIPEGQKPISLGLLPDSSGHEIEIPNELKSAISSNALLAVSDEQDGGSPTGQPTGAILALGNIIKV